MINQNAIREAEHLNPGEVFAVPFDDHPVGIDYIIVRRFEPDHSGEFLDPEMRFSADWNDVYTGSHAQLGRTAKEAIDRLLEAAPRP